MQPFLAMPASAEAALVAAGLALVVAAGPQWNCAVSSDQHGSWWTYSSQKQQQAVLVLWL